MGNGKVIFKLYPRAVSVGLTLLDLAIIIEQTSSKDDVECCVDDLDGSEWGITGGCILHRVLDLVEKSFNREVSIVAFFHTGGVGFQIGSVDLGVSTVEMSDELERGDVGITNVSVAERPNEHFIDRSDEKLLEGLVCGIILFVKFHRGGVL